MEDPELWFKAVTLVGFPVVICIMLILGLWAVGKWLAREVVLPLRDRSLKHLDALDAAIEKATAVQETSATRLASLESHAAKQNEHLAWEEPLLEDVRERLRRLEPGDNHA